MKNYNLSKYLITLVIVSTIMFVLDTLFLYKMDLNKIIAYNFIVISILIYFMLSKNDIFNPVGIFTISWILLIGISRFKLSYFQNDWSSLAWVIMLGSFISFLCGYYLNNIYIFKTKKKFNYKNINVNRLLFIIYFLLLLSCISLFIEFKVLGYLPIFSKNPLAYKEFYYKFFHYFVVLVGIIPPLTILYKACNGKQKVWYINIICIIISILIVSRQLIIFQVTTSIIVYNYSIKKIKRNHVIIATIIGIIVFSMGSILRQQDKNYMVSVSNFKNYELESIAQPYMYFTMGFDNINNLVNNSVTFENGKIFMKAIEVFTGVKVNINDTTQYLVSKNFTAPTYLYFLYIDWGIYGTLIIPFCIGIIINLIYKQIYRNREVNFNIIIYSLLLYSLIFSFFVNWFYNTTMIFYVIVLIIIKIFIEKSRVQKG